MEGLSQKIEISCSLEPKVNAEQVQGQGSPAVEGEKLVQEGEQINAEKCMVSAPAVEKV